MSSRQEIVDFLARVPMFRDLTAGQLRRLAGRFVRRTYAAGTDIVTQGKGGVGLFVIVSGSAEVIRVRTDGTKVVLNTFGSTDFFGELALLDEAPRTASVVCTEDTECLVLSQWEFLSELREDAEMGIVILRELVKRFRRALQAL
jgi:CRP/FNR family transcriptional regulator